ncbi:MAG: hypothetical protein LJE65_11870 [Desulfobacteraceae bacterium]|nr:hypothetical protein [Desulfobacteraceae bacterium]
MAKKYAFPLLFFAFLSLCPTPSGSVAAGPDFYCRQDRIFHRRTPLLFAHRGGAAVMPESTEKAFRWAWEEAGADVLELDVQITADGRFVVWHGATLRRVCWTVRRPGGTPPSERDRAISEWRWPDVADRVWVPDPGGICTLSPPADWPERRLLLLTRLLALFPDAPLNIEMKPSFAPDHGKGRGLAANVKAFSRILAADGDRRPIVVVSADHDIIEAFRRHNGDRWPTNLSPREQIALKFTEPDLHHRVLETTYSSVASSRAVVEKVRRLGGHTYVFLTAFWPWPAIDNPPDSATVFAILDRGVDGVMTDRPLAFRRIMDRWIRQRCR